MMEIEMDYPEVARLYKVISDDTILILVDKNLITKLEKGERVDPREINRKSVQMWRDKVRKTCAFEIDGFPGLLGWPEDDYEKTFLGYMKGMLRLLVVDSAGGAII